MIKTLSKKFIYILLFIICIPAISALFPNGYFYTHDGGYHLIRLFNFYNELQGGQFPVRWANNLGYSFGYPIFNYYYPLFYYLGSVIHFLGFSFENSIKILLGTSTVFSVFACYWWLKGHFNKLASFIGAVVYLYTPFRFSLMYINGQFGAVLQLLILPLILGVLDRILSKKDYSLLPILSILLAFFLTAHNLSVLIFIPLIVLYSLVLLIRNQPSRKEFMNLVIAVLLGVGLASFFILPAIFELKYVNLSLGNSTNYQDHWPTLQQLIYSKWGYGYSDKGSLSDQSFQLGIPQQLVLIGALIYLLWIKGLKRFPLVSIIIALTFVDIFLILKPSNFIWQTIPFLQQIQFPWRFLTIPLLTIPFLTAWILAQSRKIWLAIFILLLLFINNRNYLRTWETARYTMADYQKQFYQFYGTTDTSWDTKPIWAKQIPKAENAGKIIASSSATVSEVAKSNQEKRKLIIESNNATEAIINYFYFPSWKLLIDGNQVNSYPSDPGGMIAFHLTPGTHLVSLSMGSTTLEKISNLTSFISCIAILGWIFTIFKLKWGK